MEHELRTAFAFRNFELASPSYSRGGSLLQLRALPRHQTVHDPEDELGYLAPPRLAEWFSSAETANGATALATVGDGRTSGGWNPWASPPPVIDSSAGQDTMGH